jgi:3alpha(or 20beta)-hydroxysteroid dehydrogenase
MGRLDDKVVIITGAARGQGEAKARLFTDEGANVVLGDILGQEGKAVAVSIGASARYTHLDVTQEQDWESAVQIATGEFGGVDALVNNAGVLHLASLAESSKEAFERVLSVNLAGSFLAIKAVMKPIAKRGGGSIVNISSVSGISPIPGQAAYGSSQAGLAVSPEWRRLNSGHAGSASTRSTRASSTPP